MKYKLALSTVVSTMIALVGMCGIGYARLDQAQEALTILAFGLTAIIAARSRLVSLTIKLSYNKIVMVLFCILVFCSSLYSMQRALTLKYALQMILVTSFCLFTFSGRFIIRAVKKVNSLCVFVTLSVILSAIAPSLFKTLFGWMFINSKKVYEMLDQHLAVGMIGHNAYAACISNLCIGYFVARYFSNRHATKRDWLIGTLGLVGTLVTGKRIILVSIGITILFFFILNSEKRQRRKILKISFAAVALFFILYLFVPAVRIIAVRLVDGLGDSTFNNRKIFWTEALSLFHQKKLLGWGFGVFPYYDRYFGSGWGYSAHNQYFEILAELGIVGIILFGLFLLVTILPTVKLMRSRYAKRLPNIAFVAYYVFYYQVWYVIYGITGTPLYNYSQHFLYIILSLFVLSLSQFVRKKMKVS